MKNNEYYLKDKILNIEDKIDEEIALELDGKEIDTSDVDKEIQETWRHERELILDYYEKFPEKEKTLETCIDATIEINGEIIAIESVGHSYSGEIIEIKTIKELYI